MLNCLKELSFINIENRNLQIYLGPIKSSANRRVQNFKKDERLVLSTKHML